MNTELIRKSDALHAVLHHTGDAAVAAVQEIKAVDAVPVVHGEWNEENRRPRSAQFVCSVCHRTAYDIQPTRNKAWTKRCRYAYCPNCGAKMQTVTNCHTLEESEHDERIFYRQG